MNTYKAKQICRKSSEVASNVMGSEYSSDTEKSLAEILASLCGVLELTISEVGNIKESRYRRD